MMIWPRQPRAPPPVTRGADETKSSQPLSIIINFRSIKHCMPLFGGVGRAARSFKTRIDHIDEKLHHFDHFVPLTVHARVAGNGQNTALSHHSGQIEF